MRTDLLPELFIAPKNLLAVLLFYSIPAQHVLGEVSKSILFVVILLPSLLLMVGLPISHQKPTAASEF